MKRKVKKVVKEGEEKDSLLNEIKIKSQAAMEYLMTYGWAILIIALTLAVLYSLGIMNPKNFLPRAPPGSCFVFRPNGPGTTDFISLQGTCGYLPMYVASFNGNNYIDMGNNTNLVDGNRFTESLWIYPTITDSSYHGFLGYQPPDKPCCSYRAPSVWVYLSTTISAGFGDGTNWNVFGTGSIIKENNWNYVVVTFDGTYYNVSVNGVRRYSTDIYAGKVPYPTPIRNVGRVDNYFNGSIANVQIYNTALTPQEIQYLYQQGLGGGPIRLQNLVAWYPLNGDAKDYSGNNNHGTIYGGVTFVQNYNPP